MSEVSVLVDKIGTIMNETTRKVWEEIEIEENLNSGKDLTMMKWESPFNKVVTDIEADISSVLIVILHFVRGFAQFSNFKVCFTLQMFSKKVAMEINVMVHEWNNCTEENHIKVGLYGEHGVRKGGK